GQDDSVSHGPRQFKYPESSPAAARRVDLGRELTKIGDARAAEAGGHGYILPTVHAIADRIGVDSVVQTHFPQHFSGLLVVGAEPAVGVADEHHTTRRRQRGAGHRSAL